MMTHYLIISTYYLEVFLIIHNKEIVSHIYRIQFLFSVAEMGSNYFFSLQPRPLTTRWRHRSACLHPLFVPQSRTLDVLRTSPLLSHPEKLPGLFRLPAFSPHRLSNCYYTADGMRFIYLIPFTTKSLYGFTRRDQWAQ